MRSLKARNMSRWLCPVCDTGPEGNHRDCIQKFAFNIASWEAACLKNGMQYAKKHSMEISEPSPFWLKRANRYAVLPPGNYFIGDVHSALPSSLIPRLKEGAYSSGDQIYVAGTPFYNRDVPGSNGLRYEITSGYIGIMTTNLCSNRGNGSCHTFENPVEVSLEDHILSVTSGPFRIKIDTTICETSG
jgi:hypothetical protein